MYQYIKKKIIVTGGRGFIGSQLSNFFSFIDCKLTIIDNSEFTWLPLGDIAQITFEKIDLTNEESVKSTKAFDDCDYIFHLASKDIDYERKFEDDFKINALATYHILDKCKNFSSNPKIIFASSAMIYGLSNKILVNEMQPNSPPSLWATNKLTSEIYLKLFHNLFKMKNVSLRLSNVYGPSSRVEVFSRMTLNKILYNVFNKRIMYLNKNSDLARDFIYIDDVVQAFVSAANLNDDLFNGDHFVIGSGERSSYKDLSQKIKIIEQNFKIKQDKDFNMQYPELREFVADATNFKDKAKWNPKFNLQNGLQKTYDYIKENQGKLK